ncbi:MAG: hypothetical protein ABFD25_06475 [Clostridiaceae bacterium]
MKNNKVLAIIKINFMQSKLAYILTSIIFLLICGNIIIQYGSNPGNRSVSAGNYLYLLIIFAAIFIPTVNFKKFMHLNARKIDFYWGSFFNYIAFSAAVSISNLIVFYTADRFFGTRITIWNLVKIFEWSNNGMMLTFLQQFAFLLLTAVFIHTLTSMQTFWFGWTIDAVLAAVISIFIPIAPLKAVLAGFFNIIIFNNNSCLQIIACLGLSAAIYALNYIVLLRKKI